MPSIYDSIDEDLRSESSATTAMSDSSIDRFHQRAPSSVTSHDWEMRSTSPTPSVYSMTSSMREAAFKQEYGRGLNNYSDVYQLPADEEELQRLDHQHEMFKAVMGRYPPPLPAILQEDPAHPQKTVVDLGCGSGSWILDVARDFPHCTAVAIDLVPMQTLDLPPNCRSEVDDINLGLQHYFGAFDVAHARLICTGIRDYAGLVDHISNTLRGGGLIDLTEYNFVIHDGQKRRIEIPSEGELTGPWLPRWMSLVQRAIRTRGGEVEAADHLERWITQHGAFENVVHRSFWFQASPWNTGTDEESVRQNEIAKVMREDMMQFLKAARPLLLGSGIPEDLVDTVEGNAIQELKEARTPLYILIENVYARKSNDW